jgi:ATP-dependent exoDNAse (exonuclease V) alpha subunit
MNEKETTSLLLREFPYEPTSGQYVLIERLGSFITTSWENPNALFLLKGYAGTGKTTIVTALVNVLPRMKKKFVLLAPTGRAAKVLAGYTQKQANTIHRKIYFARTTKEGVIALKLQQNLYKNTLFIVDEASMIQNSSMGDLSLFTGRNLMDDLFYYVYSGENNKLLFIGDTAQLPPVGLDTSPALDPDFLKKSYHLDIESYELTEVVRQSRDSGILSNATLVRRLIDRQEFILPLFSTGGFPDIHRLIGSDLEDALNTAYSSSSKDSNVVICRSNKRANIYNQEIRRRILFFEDEINTGDYMMVVKNNYFWLPEGSSAGFIANGDIIELKRIRSIHEMYGFRFADVTIRFLDYPDEQELDVKILLDAIRSESPALTSADNNRLFQEVMKDYEDIANKRKRIEMVKSNPYFNALQVKFAYALTCHKTQGGQWEIVFLDQGYLTDKMMNVEYLRWLYTGVTRATRRLFLVNFEDKFFIP